MTNFGLIDIEFEHDYIDFENNRMYPPNHERKTMSTLNDHHLIAIARARHFMQAGITKAMEHRFIEKIERDLNLLSQVHTYIRQQISEPGLPMSPDVPEKSTSEDSDGHRD